MITEDKLNTLLKNQELIIKNLEELSKKMDKMLEDPLNNIKEQLFGKKK